MIDQLSINVVTPNTYLNRLKTLNEELCYSISQSNFLTGKFIYSNIHKLIYKVALNQSTIEYRKIHNLPNNQPIIQCLSYSEAEQVKYIMQEVIKIINFGFNYQQIKGYVFNIPNCDVSLNKNIILY